MTGTGSASKLVVWWKEWMWFLQRKRTADMCDTVAQDFPRGLVASWRNPCVTVVTEIPALWVPVMGGTLARFFTCSISVPSNSSARLVLLSSSYPDE